MMSKMNFTYVDEDSINHLLKCNICSKPFIDPVVTRDDDRFCRRCITEKLHSNQSPDFNRQSSFIEDLVPVEGRILFEILDNLLVQCQDCQQTNIRRMHFEQHLLTECPKRIVLCKASDLKCPWSGSSEEIDHHITNCSFELLRPILSETLQCQKQVEQYRLLSNEQHFQIELLKKQIEQYETRTDRLQKGFKAFLELTSQQKVRFENIQKDIQQIRELCHEQTIRQNQIQNQTEQLNQIQSQIEQLNQIDFQQIQEQYTNNQTQLQQLQQQDQYRKNEIIHLRQISDRHHVQIQLLARKKCVIPCKLIHNFFN
jgi:Asp-tRNA(Asn)/Glu-tRNA(Gln) amidotransferase C subunit